MKPVIIVGAGLAALRTAEALRASAWNGPITVVGEEVHPPYNRPPLSKQALRRGLAQADLAFRSKASLADISWLLGTRVVHAEVEKGLVITDDGRELEGSALVAATGVRPRRLPLRAGAPLTGAAGLHVVRTLEDSKALQQQLVAGQRLAVIGAGFIGCEVAATARGLGVEVVCTAADEEPMIRPLGRELARALRLRHEEHGVKFRLGVGTRAVIGDSRVTAVELTDLSILEANIAVEAVGSQCNTEWLDGNDVDTTNGVLTDNSLRVLRAGGEPYERFFAVGDVARFPNPIFDDVPRRVEHWNIPTATGRRAGEILAASLVGLATRDVKPSVFSPMPTFWSDQYDFRILSFGLPHLATSSIVVAGSLEGDVVVAYHRDDVLVGVVGVGMTKSVTEYSKRIGHRSA